jgi:lipopolysaccharide transport system permease protein
VADVTQPITIIENRVSPTSAVTECWSYRELLGFLVWRDLTIRYRQTVLGVAWALLQPLATMLVFAVLFGRLLRVPTDGVPYPPFVLAGLVPWTFLAAALGNGSTSLLTNQNLVAKVYFPRLLLPAAAVLTPAADALLAFVLTLGFVIWHGAAPSTGVVLLPFFVVLAVAVAFGTTAWLSALTVRYRDVRFTLPFATQLWLFATPVAYSSSTVPEAWRPLYALNPMVTVVDGFRWALLGTEAPTPVMVLASLAVTAVLLIGGTTYFRRVERSFADVI